MKLEGVPLTSNEVVPTKSQKQDKKRIYWCRFKVLTRNQMFSLVRTGPQLLRIILSRDRPRPKRGFFISYPYPTLHSHLSISNVHESISDNSKRRIYLRHRVEMLFVVRNFEGEGDLPRCHRRFKMLENHHRLQVLGTREPGTISRQKKPREYV